MTELAIIVFGTWVIISFVTFSSGHKSVIHHRYNEPRTKTNWNLIALILNVYVYIIGVNWKDMFYPKSGIDKEIAEEEKEITELERQKEKMDKLEELKRRKERLFEEVQESEVEREEALVICDSCGNYMDYLGIDRSRREVYECKGCNHTLKVPLCTN